MTDSDTDDTLFDMAIEGKPGRRPGTPAEFQEALKLRLKGGRESARLDLAQMAAELSARVGRPITADTYRKWESESLIPHDAILPACDIMEVHVFKFLGPVTREEVESQKKSWARKIRYLKAERSGS
jgi:hypothetical protein